MISKPHVEGPDFERMAEAREIINEAREDRADIKSLRDLLAEAERALRHIDGTASIAFADDDCLEPVALAEIMRVTRAALIKLKAAR